MIRNLEGSALRQSTWVHVLSLRSFHRSTPLKLDIPLLKKPVHQSHRSFASNCHEIAPCAMAATR
jgi:hypothetical protein